MFWWLFRICLGREHSIWRKEFAAKFFLQFRCSTSNINKYEKKLTFKTSAESSRTLVMKSDNGLTVAWTVIRPSTRVGWCGACACSRQFMHNFRHHWHAACTNDATSSHAHKVMIPTVRRCGLCNTFHWNAFTKWYQWRGNLTNKKKRNWVGSRRVSASELLTFKGILANLSCRSDIQRSRWTSPAAAMTCSPVSVTLTSTNASARSNKLKGAWAMLYCWHSF